MKVSSPITYGSNVVLERTIDPNFIITEYKSSYNIDVAEYFRGLTEIGIFKCKDSGFRFYGPSNIDGNGKFYEQLQQFPWYYMDWKWEHQVVSDMLRKNQDILEIGCAQGAFINGIKDKGCRVVGLELNEEAARKALKNGLQVLTETIQEHSENNEGRYDVVCSFQVMEHIADVKSVIEASVKALRKGGKLMISVPNNNSFIKRSPNSILNMPPHHMNLWDDESLTNIAKVYKLTLDKLVTEPLQKYHYPVVWSNALYRTLPSKFLAKVLNKISVKLGLYNILGLWKNKIVGHSIIAVYIK